MSSRRRRRSNFLTRNGGASTLLLGILLLLTLTTTTTTTTTAAASSDEPIISTQNVDEPNHVNQKTRNRDAFHGRRRSLLLNPLERKNNAASNSTNSSTLPTPSQVNVTIEASALPLFQCRTEVCRNTLTQQQDSILANLSATFANVTLLASTQRIANALFVQLDVVEDHSNSDTIFETLRQMHGVQRVLPQETYQPYQFFFGNFFGSNSISMQDYLGVPSSTANDCHTTQNATPIRIAVLDSGMDYTHERLGGPGSTEAYEAAYGVNGIESPQNTQVDSSGFFPNEVVVDGYDFLGDTFLHTADSTEKDARHDTDPIDAVPGHGTAVADAIRQVAPQALLMALKVCSTTGHTCPDFAIAQAIEYALDPKGDGSREGGVDVINLSLGLPYFSPYYDFISKLLEDVFHLGVVPVVAMGNHFNVPMVGGYSSVSPSIISVGATLHPREQSQLSSSNTNPSNKEPTMAAYSSRGPGFGGMIKPDLVAPSGMRLAASGTGTGMYSKLTGTSFAAPLVAGAVALLKQKCGNACSPFAIKALLMNNAFRDVRYEQDSNTGGTHTVGAPISHMGAGELQVKKSLDATFWAYCVDDVQPSVSLGVLNVASTMVLERTLRITSISPNNQSLVFSAEFRDKNKEASGALAVEFSTLQVDLAGNTDAGNCLNDDSSESSNNFVDVNVTFTIDATKIPPNHMTSTGPIRDNAPLTLDINEFGGHLIITSGTDSTDINVPFMAILRQASDVSVTSSKLKYDGKPAEMSVGLTNHGAGVAQIDAFQVLSFGKDEKEAKFGDAVEKADLRMLGYRVVTPPIDQSEECTYVFEWAFQTWEPQARLQTTVFEVQIDVDDDQNIDYMISNAVVNSKHSGAAGDILIRSAEGEVKCAGLYADHHTFSTTTVLRVCSDDLGITKPGDMVVQARVMTVQYTGEVQTTASSGYATYLTYPEPEIASPSYDVGPGETLESISLSGTNKDGNGYPPLGLMLMTNAYRHPNSTGAAVKGTETILVLADFVSKNFEVHQESTSNDLRIPSASNLNGPTCSWSELCTKDSSTFLKSGISLPFSKEQTAAGKEDFDPTDFKLLEDGVDKLPSCPLRELQQRTSHQL